MCFYTERLSAASQDEEERAVSAPAWERARSPGHKHSATVNSIPSSPHSWQEIRGGLRFTLSEPIPPRSRDVKPSANDSWVGFLYLIVRALVQFRRAKHATWIPPASHRRTMNGGFLHLSGRTSPMGAGISERPPLSLLKHTQLCFEGKR